MNINWKLKSYLFKCIEVFSLHNFLYFIQKNITRRAKVRITELNENWITHKKNIEPLKEASVLEFGAGKSLQQNIYLSYYIKNQTVIDLFPMLDTKLATEASIQISKICPFIQAHHLENIEDLHRHYRIKYMAPVDLENSPFADNTFDACISTNTLEHIPLENIINIFSELKRIVRSQGLISAVIDYSDHYSHTDRRIGRLNYLKFSHEKFKKYNHTIHYQNRLRHYDYLKIFKNLNYEVVKETCSNFAELPNIISDQFDKENPTLGATKGIFLLRNKK